MRIEKIYCIKCNKYIKSKTPKKSYVFDNILVIFIICHNCGSNGDIKILRY